jgi:hypothetical protein
MLEEPEADDFGQCDGFAGRHYCTPVQSKDEARVLASEKSRKVVVQEAS